MRMFRRFGGILPVGTNTRVLVALVGGMVAMALILRPVMLVNGHEAVMLRYNPTADRAFAYAERHFDAAESESYDLVRAKHYFTLALALDPAFPSVRHELSRIAFLEGDFGRALAFIDKEIILNPEPSPASYYIRALVKGYMQDYEGAAKDYETYFAVTPANWAAINDYSWVLMKQGLSQQALEALNWGLGQWPENAWLLSNKATALYDLGRDDDAIETARNAQKAVKLVTKYDWLVAYPGNDPLIAEEGLAAFRQAIDENLEQMEKKHPAQY